MTTLTQTQLAWPTRGAGWLWAGVLLPVGWIALLLLFLAAISQPPVLLHSQLETGAAPAYLRQR
jgi:hypothetical protein